MDLTKHSSATIFLQTLDKLKGVGQQRSQILLRELGIKTLGDLFFYFPFKHIDRSKITAIRDLKEEDGYVQLKGQFYDFREIPSSGGKSRLEAIFFDSSGAIKIVWFTQYKWVLEKISKGITYYLFGRVSRFSQELYIAHPEITTEEEFKKLPYSGKLQPVYGTTERMKKQGIDSRFIAKLVQQVVDLLPETMEEVLPEELLMRLKLPRYPDAFKRVHFPSSLEEYDRAIKRFKFQEALSIHLKNELLLRQRRKQACPIQIKRVGDLFHTFYNQYLPFQLTEAQKRVIREIFDDLRSGYRMNRLLQGDVGSGKTMVALLVSLIAIGNGWQVAFMVPTEILAQQHFQKIQSLLSALPIRLALLTGSTSRKVRKQVLEGLESGEIHFIIGTHALIEEDVRFKNLGLVIIDEQHRFGVVQRAKIQLKSEYQPHVLVMTATPIPRTLAMTIYGDLDTSIIDELPPGRKPIKTIHYLESFRYLARDLMKKEILAGRQAYVIYPLIEENEKLDLIALEEGYEAIKKEFSRYHVEIAILHGKMKSSEKEQIMQDFKAGKIHILVSTTVIEVGIDVPTATVMIIEHAERFGLAQLHQLRGRVGRGGDVSYCILITPDQIGEDAKERIQIFTSTNNGFLIAEADLKLRGMGDLDGTRQSGDQMFRFIEPISDDNIIKYAQKIAMEILKKDPSLETSSYICLRNLLENTWQGLRFFDIA